MAERLAQGQLHKFVAGGRTVYEWEQSLAEVNVYVPVPPGMAAREIFCDITRQHLKFGRAGNPPFLDVRELCRLVACRATARAAAPQGGGQCTAVLTGWGLRVWPLCAATAAARAAVRSWTCVRRSRCPSAPGR
jgi:hypothetical protein